MSKAITAFSELDKVKKDAICAVFARSDLQALKTIDEELGYPKNDIECRKISFDVLPLGQKRKLI